MPNSLTRTEYRLEYNRASAVGQIKVRLVKNREFKIRDGVVNLAQGTQSCPGELTEARAVST